MLILVLCLGWAFLATRDTHTMSQLIPADQSYAVYVPDLLSRRDTIAASPLWELLPEDSAYLGWRDSLADNFGLPEWVLNNFIYGLCHVSGRDLASFEDVLLITRMTSVGTLLEKLHGFSDLVEPDHAGGLELRHVQDFGLYYAVRGRVLVASPSREAVIDALTLTSETAVSEERLADASRSMNGALLLGRFRLPAEHRVGTYIDGAEVRLWLEGQEARASVRMRPQEHWRPTFARLAGEAAATDLPAPPPGPIALAADFGGSAPEVWSRWAMEAGWTDPWEAATAYLEGLDPEYGVQSRLMLDTLRGGVGGAWSLSLADVNTDAIFPVPELLLGLDARGLDFQGLMTQLPASAPEGDPWAPVPRYDESRDLVTVPMMGGPALAPAFGGYGNGILLSNSTVALERVIGNSNQPTSLGATGNLYCRIAPSEALATVMKGLLELAEFGLVRDHTPASLKHAAAPYEALSKKVSSLSGLLSIEGEAVRVDVRVALQGEGTAASGG
jgi:hypothetical protein